MKILMILLLPYASAFSIIASQHPRVTALEATTRRNALEIMVAAGVTFPMASRAFSQQLDDYAYEPSQQATDGKFDLNAAFVGDYKELRGMFPSAAGKIASHGPYKKVKDIYKIPGLNEHDLAMFKKYEKEFTVKIPGRTFDERINARVST